MEKQEIFNKVWQHFIVEKNPRGYDAEAENCVYKNQEGNKCAIGIFIPDDKFIPAMNNWGTIWSFKDAKDTLSRYGCENLLVEIFGPEYNMKFLSELQKAHDHIHERSMEENLRRLAVKWSLQIPGEIPEV